MRVLLVDDDADLREVLSDILKTRGIESVPVETGAAALARVEQQDIDVALIDLKLEDMSGLEVVRGIKARSANTECILLTGYASQATAIEAINLGAYAYFLKPYDIDQLLVSIRRAGEKRTAERALAKSEARLAGIFRVAPIAIGVVRERVIQQVNARMCEMTGYAPDELIGQSVRIIYPDDAEFERVGREKYAQIHEKDTGAVETRWKHKDGRIMDILLASTPLVTGDPSAGVTFTALDITERKQAEGELRSLSTRQEAILSAVPDILMEVDKNKVYTWANPSGVEFFGEDVIGHNAAFYFEGEQDTYGLVQPLFSGNEDVIYVESWQRRRDGEKRLLAWRCRMLKDTDGNVIGALSSAHDITESRLAEESLRKTNDLLETIFSNMHLMLAYLDRDFNFVRVNRAYAEADQRSPDFFPGQNHFALFPNAENQAIFQNVVDSGEPYYAYAKPFEYAEHPERGISYWDWSLVPTKDAAGRVSHLILGLVNVTERKQAEKALGEVEEKYRAIFEGAVEGIFQSTSEGRFLTVNPALARMWGYDSPGDLISSIKDIGLQVYARPERREDFRRLIQEQGEVRGFEFEALRKDGKAMWVSENARTVRDAGGTLLYYEGNIEDISERKQAEEALRKSGADLKEAQRVGRIGSWDWDATTDTINWSEEYYRIYGFDPKQRPPGYEEHLKAYTPESAERLDAAVKKSMQTGMPYELDLECASTDGARRWVTARSEIKRGANGQIVGLRGTAQDITERKQAEQERLAHLRFFEKMDKVNRAIQGTSDLEQMMSDALEATLSIFDCDRSWLLYPCDPDAPSFRVPMEVTRPEYPGAKVLNVDIPMSPGEAQNMREALDSDAPVTYTAGTERPITTAKQFGVQSQLFVPVYPKLGKPWVFGMHQCSYPRVWTEDERKLFQEIGRRLTDGLTSLLAYRDLRESEEMLRESQRIAGLGSYVIDFASGMWTSSNILDEIVGIDETYKRSIESLAALVHPDDRDQILDYFTNDIAGTLAAFDKVVRIIRDNDKAERWVHGLGKLELDERGQIIRMHGTILDVTERKQAEKQLKDSGKRFRGLIENAAEMILVIDQAGMIKFASPSVKLIMGYESEDAVGTSFLGWVHPEDIPLALESLESRSKTPGTASSSIIVRGRHADGTWRFVEVLGTNLLGEDAIQGIVLNARDVTERKRHERELEAEAMIAQALSETLELQPLLNMLLDAARYAIPAAEKGSLALMADDEHLQVRAISGYQESSVLGYLYPITWGYAGRVARERHPALIPNVQADAGLREDARSATIGELQELCSAIAVPLLVQDTVIGVLSMESALPGAFNEDDLRLLGNFATSAALIIERARLFETTHQRVAELEMLHESGLALNQLLTPKEIGYEIIELLKQKMDWHHIAIRLYHPQNETLELLAFSQPGLKRDVEQKEIAERFKTLVPKVGVGLSGWAVQNSQTIRSGDVGNDPHYVETYPGLHSGLYVPMKSGQRIIGVISIESEQPNAFSGADERLVVTLTNQAASALENARLFEETRQRVMELETVNRISIALRAILNPDEMLAVVLEETLAALKVAHGSINLMNDGTGKLHKSMARGWPSEFTEAPIEPGQGIFGTVFATGNFYLSRDFANDPLTRLEARGRLPSGWGGICVPIRSAQKMLGVMLVSIPTEREFNKDEIRLLNTLADMTGNALYRMKLYDETVHRAEEFSSLYETNAVISGEHDLDTLMQTIVKSATALLKAKAGELYIYDPLTQELEVTVATHSFIPVGTRLRFGEGMAGRVAQSLQPLRVGDYSSWEGRSKQYQNTPFRAVLEVPIIFGGELIGVLVTYEFGASDRTFSESDERLLSLFAAEAAGVIRSARLREETQRRLENLQALREVDRLITSSFDLQPILSTVITHTIIQLGVDAADVLLFNPVLQTLKYAAGYGFNTNGITQTVSRLGEGHAGNAALTRRTVHVSNLPETGSQFMRASLLAGENFMEYYGVPLISKGEVKGVLEVFQRSSFHPKPEWVELLETLAGQAAIAIDNTQLFESIQRSNMELALAYDATIEGWSRAMELRDEETEGHTQRVTEMAVTLARALEMTDENVLHLRRGALLHDIGKIGVPDHILLKPGKLTEQEWEIMRKHPQFAYEMLRSITYLRSSIDIPHLHHEKWDGTGYPQGLKGEQIPLAARIFAIVDVYDALTSDRPYRKAWAKTRALKYIREQSGKHFDPQVVEKFLQIFGNKKI